MFRFGVAPEVGRQSLADKVPGQAGLSARDCRPTNRHREVGRESFADAASRHAAPSAKGCRPTQYLSTSEVGRESFPDAASRHATPSARDRRPTNRHREVGRESFPDAASRHATPSARDRRPTQCSSTSKKPYPIRPSPLYNVVPIGIRRKSLNSGKARIGARHVMPEHT